MAVLAAAHPPVARRAAPRALLTAADSVASAHPAGGEEAHGRLAGGRTHARRGADAVDALRAAIADLERRALVDRPALRRLRQHRVREPAQRAPLRGVDVDEERHEPEPGPHLDAVEVLAGAVVADRHVG